MAFFYFTTFTKETIRQEFIKYRCSFGGRQRARRDSNRDTAPKTLFGCSFSFIARPDGDFYDLYLKEKHVCSAPADFAYQNLGLRSDLKFKILTMYKNGNDIDEIDTSIKTETGPSSAWYVGRKAISDVIYNYCAGWLYKRMIFC